MTTDVLNTTQMATIINKYGKDLVAVLIDELKKTNKNSTGTLLRSLKPDVKDLGTIISLIVNSEDYLKYVDEGRKPGSYPNISALSRWASINGISQNAVYPIARKIYKFGIKPTNVIDKSVNVFMKIAVPKMEKDIATKIEQDIVTNLEKK